MDSTAGALTVALQFLRSWRGSLLGATLISLGSWPAPFLTPASLELAAAPSLLRQGPRQVAAVPVQRSRDRSLAKGKLLVASSELRDPNFAETVVLLIEYGEQGAMGVIINRTTRVKLSELLPQVRGLEQRGDTIYQGGPVGRSEILMLVRAAEAPEDSRVVFGDVHLSASAELLKRLAADSPPDAAPFRVYSGYAGWAAGQLEAEVGLGAWHIFPATAAAVFTPLPEGLWRELLDTTTLRLAGVWQGRASPLAEPIGRGRGLPPHPPPGS